MNQQDKSNKELALEQAYQNLSLEESKAYERWQNSNEPTIAPSTQAKFFELFLAGKECQEIQRLNPTFSLGMIIQARLMGRWDERREQHLTSLLDGVRERVQQVTLESVNFIADMLSAANKLHGDKLKRFIQSGDEKDLDGLAVNSLKTYKETVELLMKMTGQGEVKKGEVKHLHMTVDAIPRAARPMTPKEASEHLRVLEEKNKK